jgi:U3 small nucleolar RNA-associated protein 18
MPEAKAKNYKSPLTMAALKEEEEPTSKKVKRQEMKSRKRARREAKEDMEEDELTKMIFGGDKSPGAAAWEDNDDEDLVEEEQPQQQNDEEFGFQIDRSGAGEEGKRRDIKEGRSDGEVKAASEHNDEAEDAPAWVDDEDEAEVSLVEGGSRLRKLRHARNETQALTADELEQRLRKRYEESTQRTARTDWASTKPKSGQDEEEDNAAKLFSTAGSLLASSRNRLPPNVLKIVRCPDANQSDYSQAVVRAVHFHPGSDPEKPLLLTAGLDKSLRFFQVGAEKSEKIHGIHCK